MNRHPPPRDDPRALLVPARVDKRGLRSREIELRVSAGGRTVDTRKVKTDDRGTASFSLKMPSSQAKTELLIPGVDVPVVRAELRWVPPRAMLSELAQPIVRERKTAKLLVRFPHEYRPADGRVHVDVTDTSGAIVAATLLEVKKEGSDWVARGEFDGPSWGSMLS